jgi:hypothetical protein
MRMISALSLLLIVSACGSHEAPPAQSPAVRSARAEESIEKDSPDADSLDKGDFAANASRIPSCDPDAEECLPPTGWVEKLCSGVHPEVALHMFRGGSPWKRLYSRARAPAYNAAGGPSLSDERVEKGEELIALRRNSDGIGASASKMTVGDTAGYDLLRWNGSCVTLQDGEYSTKAPRRREHARVEWRWLGDAVRSALTSDGTVKEAYVARRKECRGATLGRVTKKCVEREHSLVSAIVEYVRAGGELPDPNERL